MSSSTDDAGNRCPEDLLAAFVAAFNSGDHDRLERLHEPGAVFVPEPGTVLAGAHRRRATREFIALGVPISVRLRHVYVSGDLALIVNDFAIRGTGRDGTVVDQAGVATDVVRRGADGRWRYAVSVPDPRTG